jgi:hypothetical protein
VGAAQRAWGTLQTGGNTIRPRTASALNEFFDTNHHKRVWGRALEDLKSFSDLPPNHHAKILENGDYVTRSGEFIGNIMDFMP